MRRSVWERIREILKKHVIHGKWVRAVISLACVVIFITTYVLIMPAVTLSRAADCGQEEHTHTEDCYETESELTCGQEEHTHSGDCYDEEGNLICGMEEHVHDDSCYTSREVLVCGQEEHAHTEDCYAEEEVIQEDISEEAEEEFVSENEEEQPEQPQAGDTVMEQAGTAAPEQLSQIRFKDHLTDWTTLYYAPEDGDNWQPLAEDKWHSLYKDNWGIRRDTADRGLDPEEYVLLHIGYRIPAGQINATNPEAEFILPLSINMTEEEVRDNNKYYDTLFSGTDREADELFADGKYEIKEEWNSDGEVTQRKLVITFNEDACLRCGGEKLTDGTKTLAPQELEGFFELRVKAEDLLTLKKQSESAYVLKWNDEEDLDSTVRFDPEKLAAYYDAKNGESAETEETEVEEPVSGELRAEGEDYTITVSYTEEAGLPADVSLKVKEITKEKEYESYKAQMEEELIDLESTKVTGARFFDITLEDSEGNELHPESGVRVLIETKDTLKENEKVQICHFDEEKDKPVEVESREVTSETYEEENLGVEFEAESFSVYGVVYTVDFHYGVDGKTYEYSLAGGDSISLRDLILSLHIFDEDSENNGSEWNQSYSDETVAENTDESIKETDAENTAEDSAEKTVESIVEDSTETALEHTVEDPAENVEENSDDFQKAQEFIDNIDQVSFSDESLVKVVKIEEDITAGELKKSLNLEPEYSADLTAEQIEQLNARQFSAVDWALISMKAFNTEETLTITMLSGEVFEIKVTDLQFKKYVISASGDTFEVTVSYGDDANIPADAELKVKEILPKDTRYSELIEKSEEELDKVTVGKRNMVLFEIAVMVNGVEVEPAEGSTVNVEIVSKDADLLPDVVAKDETAVQATGENSNPQDEVLMSDDSNSLVLVNGVPVSGPEEITAVQVIHHKNNGESEAVQNITTSADEGSVKASFRTGSLSNWLLCTDRADTTPNEITIKVGDTITLRPIGSWDRKDELGNQGFDGSAVDNWERPVDSSVMRFEAFTKTDSQDTRNNVERKYQYYTGTALSTGSITLRTKDGKQLIVHVEQGGPSAKPGTVDTVDNNKEGITFNLFDYDIPGGLDYYRNMGYNSSTTADGVSDCYIRNETVNQLTNLKFLGWGYAGNASGVSRENWYQAQTPTQGIVQDDLSGGYPVMSGGNNLRPLFDTSRNDNAVTAYPNANGLFQKDSDGYYYYNSNTNYAEYNKGSNSFTVYESTYTQASGNAYDSNGRASKDNTGKNGKPIGFFPFHEFDSNNDLQVNLNKELNHHFGIDMSVDFVIPTSGYDANGKPIIFEFSGDDDLWVFIDGKLVLDIGGVHQPLTGKINFSEKTVEVEGISGTESFDIVEDDTVSHTMQVFYIERGGCDSNLNIRFNLPILKPIEVEKKLEGETSSAYTDQEFSFKLFVQKSTKTEDANTYIPYEGNYKVYNSQGQQVGDEKHTSDGTFKLKDGQHIETEQRLDTLKYYVEESGVDYKYFGTTKIDNLDTPGQIAPKTYDDTSYSVTSAKTVIRDDSDVVFTNIPVTGNIKLIKKDAERKNTLKGAIFELTKKDDTSFGKKVYTTNAAGKLMNGNDCIDDLNLMPGEYILTETKAPDGYIQILPITFKIEGAKDPDDNTKFKVNVTTTNETIQSTFNKETGEFIVPNTSGVVLPATGGPGTRLFTILGSILIAGAGLVWMRKRRRAEFSTE